ncbi:CGNR zinc finger domain-containing protein [Luteipulveratus sp. YIM 133132]|uniref:CGNR zinc finger domain-containing protein n=1 Tax=Luteipulveratus flavus TaxID=3031728 RepID=A0ABT6C7F9_9MICO|nr:MULTISPECIES: CGNR zinc finger domain-containing protein [unclassified Luteipulveratus]MDE9364945.1 CGNR zinc finger domain-containing protein [Luteipulveratus sp. YIM 133132]MDF8264715.1 CGNR zinc finger domain-containing protein [Luteipulveratus sp. YIM 133296]
MLFTHDAEVALASAAALVNTQANGPRSVEELPDVAALDAFVESWGWTGERRHDDLELAQVRALRPRLREVWSSDVDGVVRIVNDLLARAQALPQLVRHDGWDYHLHATTPQAPLATRMAVEAAMALVDVVRAGELSRLRVCAADDCEDLLVDLSKNRSRRYCDAGCGNRVNVAAYRARQAAAD